MGCDLGELVAVKGLEETRWNIDSVSGDIPLTLLYCEQMATAVVRIYTSEGWIVAADGLRKDADGNVLRKDVQKIFTTTDPRWTLAVALSGWTWSENNRGTIDWIEEARRIADNLKLQNPSSLSAYA